MSQCKLLDLLRALEYRPRESTERFVLVYFMMGLLRAHPLLEVVPDFICMVNEHPLFKEEVSSSLAHVLRLE